MNPQNTLIIGRKIFRALLAFILGVFMSLLSFFIFFLNLDLFTRAVGLSGFVFFSICTFFILKVKFKNRNILVINNEGITDNSTALALGFIPWSDVKYMRIGFVGSQKFIDVGIRNEALYLERLNRWQRKVIKINQKMGFSMVAINLTFTGYKPEDVLSIMQGFFENRIWDE